MEQSVYKLFMSHYDGSKKNSLKGSGFGCAMFRPDATTPTKTSYSDLITDTSVICFVKGFFDWMKEQREELILSDNHLILDCYLHLSDKNHAAVVNRIRTAWGKYRLLSNDGEVDIDPADVHMCVKSTNGEKYAYHDILVKILLNLIIIRKIRPITINVTRLDHTQDEQLLQLTSMARSMAQLEVQEMNDLIINQPGETT